jgi:hypothetical protein
VLPMLSRHLFYTPSSLASQSQTYDQCITLHSVLLLFPSPPYSLHDLSLSMPAVTVGRSLLPRYAAFTHAKH